MTIGVGVEGPSDRAFWHKVLHKHFRGFEFDIRNMKNRNKLIRETPQLLENFRSAHYLAAFILVDRDESKCVSSVLGEFDQSVRQEARKSIEQRYLFVCVAIKELEAWYLADEVAISRIFPRSNYQIPAETGALNAEKELQKFWRDHFTSSFNKLDFAKRIAPSFKPELARSHSTSFSYFWQKVNSKIQEARKEK